MRCELSTREVHMHVANDEVLLIFEACSRRLLYGCLMSLQYYLEVDRLLGILYTFTICVAYLLLFHSSSSSERTLPLSMSLHLSLVLAVSFLASTHPQLNEEVQ
jgi:hypothetical protein